MNVRGRVIWKAFGQLMEQIRKDAMMAMLCIAPVLCGLFFRFGVPLIQSLLSRYFGLTEVLLPYYLLFDLLLGTITPVLYCFAAAFVILGEIDDGISKYYAVTPVGKNGYLISRLGMPALTAFIISTITLFIFRLTEITLLEIILVSFASGLLGIIQALIIVSFSTNKVEGMAISKLSGLLFLGLPVPFFISENIQYWLLPIPSFWVAKFAVNHNGLDMILCIVISVFWILLLQKKFVRKIR